MLDAFFQICQCDGFDDLRFADLREGDEADFSGFEFLVAGQAIHDGGSGDGFGKDEGEVEMTEEADDLF